jgi:HK97 family phage prohead protease
LGQWIVHRGELLAKGPRDVPDGQLKHDVAVTRWRLLHKFLDRRKVELGEDAVRASTDPVEYRILADRMPTPDTRSTGGTGPTTVGGYASVFYREGVEGTEFVAGDVHERIVPGAFRGLFGKGAAIPLVPGHDWNVPLATTSDGSLVAHEDQRGLRFSATLDDDSTGTFYARAVQRGAMSQASIAFKTDLTGEEWYPGGAEFVVREIRQIKQLYDLTITPWGAFSATSAKVERSTPRSRVSSWPRDTDPTSRKLKSWVRALT